MIRTGEHYTVETIGQFLDRTGFGYHDVAEALVESHYDVESPVDIANDVYDPDDVDFVPAESVGELPEDEISEWLGAYNVATYKAIIATLERDDREWVHLFDGHVHDIVELFPENNGGDDE